MTTKAGSNHCNIVQGVSCVRGTRLSISIHTHQQRVHQVRPRPVLQQRLTEFDGAQATVTFILTQARTAAT